MHWDNKVNGLVLWAYRTENRVFLVDTFKGVTMENLYDIENRVDASFLKHRHFSKLLYERPSKPHKIK